MTEEEWEMAEQEWEMAEQEWVKTEDEAEVAIVDNRTGRSESGPCYNVC